MYQVTWSILPSLPAFPPPATHTRCGYLHERYTISYAYRELLVGNGDGQPYLKLRLWGNA